MNQFLNAEPFPHIVLDGLWPDDMLREAAQDFASIPGDKWVRYNSRDERGKRAYNGELPSAAAKIINWLASPAAIQLCSLLTGLDVLQSDPSLYGGGLHETEQGGFLGLHLDNERHPQTGLARRLNAIVYLTEDWQESWGGELELWDRSRSRAVKRIAPLFNRTVVFETGSHSYHGQPTPLACPAGTTRKSIAVYYWSEPRSRARFLPTANEATDAAIEAARLERSRAMP